jgi:hypothetical protein
MGETLFLEEFYYNPNLFFCTFRRAAFPKNQRLNLYKPAAFSCKTMRIGLRRDLKKQDENQIQNAKRAPNVRFRHQKNSFR